MEKFFGLSNQTLNCMRADLKQALIEVVREYGQFQSDTVLLERIINVAEQLLAIDHELQIRTK